MSKKKVTITPTDAAFTDSDKHSLAGERLQPWTPDRIIAAQGMGMLYPNLGVSDWAQYRRTKIYPGAVKDVMIFVYLSTLDEESLDLATYEAAKKAGIEKGLHLADSAIFWEAYSKFVEVNNEIAISATKPKPLPGQKQQEDDDPNE